MVCMRDCLASPNSSMTDAVGGALVNSVVSAALCLVTGLAHAEYYGPPQTFSGSTDNSGVIYIAYRNPDSFQNLSDLTLTLVQRGGISYHLDGFGFTGGGTPAINADQTSLSLTNLSTFAGGLFDFSVVIDQGDYKPGQSESKYKSGAINYTLTPSYTQPFSPVPEVGTWRLMLAGLSVVGIMRNRRKNV